MAVNVYSTPIVYSQQRDYDINQFVRMIILVSL